MDISQEEFDTTYKIEELIGEGAFGTVHKANNVKNGLDYAVKSIEIPYNQEARKVILREKESLRKMNHENVIKSYHYAISKVGNLGKSKTL